MEINYDVCIIHLADARYYPLFKRQAFTLREKGFKVALVSWENIKNTGDPVWDGIDVFPVCIPSDHIGGKIFFLKYFIFTTLLLLRIKTQLYQAVDPPALWPARIAAFFHHTKYNYFSLEYFQGTSALAGRPIIKNIWRLIEKTGIKYAKNIAVVGKTAGDLLKSEYDISTPVIIRNVPKSAEYQTEANFEIRDQFNIKPDEPVLVYKGSLEKKRGIVPVFKAMKKIERIHFILIGSGPDSNQFKKTVDKEGLNGRVHFAGLVKPEVFPAYIKSADLGHVLHEKSDFNLHTTLPSKLFDFIHAGVPVLAGDGPEIAPIIKKHEIGWTVQTGDHNSIEMALNSFLSTFPNREHYQERCKKAAEEFCWEKESKTYLQYINEAIR